MELNARKRAITEVLATYECALQTRTHLVAIAESVKGHKEAVHTSQPMQRNKLRVQTHSITSSARATIHGGTARPNALVVLRLMASSKVRGSCTGRSAGLSPLSMRPAYVAA
jgi:hypothetical protein